MTNVRKKGFTLVEVMIVVAIVAILATIAVPAFLDAVRKSRRSDAMNAIQRIHMAQELFRANNPDYGAAGTTTSGSPDGHYSLSLVIPASPANRTEYTIIADALNEQADDSCGDFTLAFNAGVITKTADGIDALCWKK